MLRYLIATQQPDGHWFQNQWLGGAAFWQGVQLDEAAFPILLAAALQRTRRARRHSGRRRRSGAPLASSPAKAPRPSRTAGKRTPGSTSSRSRSRSPRSSRPAPFSKARRRTSRCGWPTTGTRGWRAGPLSPTRRWRSQFGVERLLHPHLAGGRAVGISRRWPNRCRSRISPPIPTCPPTPRSPPISCSSCATGCGAPTIRASATA